MNKLRQLHDLGARARHDSLGHFETELFDHFNFPKITLNLQLHKFDVQKPQQ